MKQELQKWVEENIPDDKLIWGDGLAYQVGFVGGTLPQLLFSSYEEAQQHPCVVISTHTSKSVCLPVYQFELPNGIVITMRNNFYDWKVSVSSPEDVEMDVMRLFDPKSTPRYFEGFPEELVYGSYAANKWQFSVMLYDDFQVYTFFWILGEKMGLRVRKAG